MLLCVKHLGGIENEDLAATDWPPLNQCAGKRRGRGVGEGGAQAGEQAGRQQDDVAG
jgi:hypothetical protein